jgi:hypothetical protein
MITAYWAAYSDDGTFGPAAKSLKNSGYNGNRFFFYYLEGKKKKKKTPQEKKYGRKKLLSTGR